MTRTDEQKEVESLLADLSEAPGLTANERKVIRICRVQQEEIAEFQNFLKNIGLGFKIIGGIGAVTAFVISTIGGVLGIKGYFK